ncbi:hypothetical protein [Bdellovibrio sp.]|uniref:hypothetical protein n=1 Tax=Bdellovibrio TaxID=958 RepID=UPI0032215BCE
MNSSARQTFLLVLLLLSSTAYGEGVEETRLKGFAQHQNSQDRFEKARQQGERAYLEEEEQWENQKDRALNEYKKTKTAEKMSEEGPEAKADAVAKEKFDDAYEQERLKYIEKKNKQEVVTRGGNLPTEAQELGLLEDRPRYDYRKRAMYGAKPKYGKSSPGSSSSSGSSSPSYGGGSSFPPPPTFDDFGGDGGYVPAPNVDDFGGDIPPPPPPPPFSDDFGGGFGGDGDFPPPPPPPPFEGGTDF